MLTALNYEIYILRALFILLCLKIWSFRTSLIENNVIVRAIQ